MPHWRGEHPLRLFIHLFPHPFCALCENFSPMSFKARSPAKAKWFLFQNIQTSIPAPIQDVRENMSWFYLLPGVPSSAFYLHFIYMLLSTDQKTKVVKSYWETQSIVTVQRRYRTCFKTFTVPCSRTILRQQEKFLGKDTLKIENKGQSAIKK